MIRARKPLKSGASCLPQLNTVEQRIPRRRLTTEAEADADTPDANGLTGAEREFGSLSSKAELACKHSGTVMNGNAADRGRGASCKSIAACPGRALPFDLIAPRPAPRTEDRAVTPAPS